MENEVMKLKRLYKFEKDKRIELENDYKQLDEQLIEVQANNDRFALEIASCRSNTLQIKELVQKEVNKAVEQKEKEIKQVMLDRDRYRKELDTERANILKHKEIIDEKDDVIMKYKQYLREHADVNFEEITNEVEDARQDRLMSKASMQKLMQRHSVLESQMEDVLAENKLLRKMAQVSENYGFNLEDIKLEGKMQIEEYKAQVRRLERELEELEGERAQLRYRLRQLHGGDSFADLSKEQQYMVQQYIFNLKEGSKDIPLNDKSKKLQQQVDQLKGQIEVYQQNQFSQTQQVAGGSQTQTQKNYAFTHQGSFPNVDQNTVDALTKQNQELKEYMQKIFAQFTSSDGFANQMKQNQQNQSQPLLHNPPNPIPGPFGNYQDIREGISHKFSDSKIRVDYNDLYNEQGFDLVGAKYEIAFLQLHNLECLRLLKLKEEEYSSMQSEVKTLKEEMKRHLIVEDTLFRNYYAEKLQFTESLNKCQKEMQNAKEECVDLRIKNTAYIQYMEEVERKDPQSMETKLSHFSKRVALLDVNLIKLSRKYDCIADEEKHLRQAYHTVDTNYQEKMRYLYEKLHSLSEWKQKGQQQLRMLLEMQQNSFPIEEKNALLTKYELIQDRYAAQLVKEADMQKQLAVKESAERELFESKEELRLQEEEMGELEIELEIYKSRLERLDPHFKKYMEVFQRIVAIIKEKNISPLQTFKLIDVNGDGKISKAEFFSCLKQMQINISNEENEIVFLFLDLDGSGVIEYREFLRRLMRCGVKVRRKEEDLIYTIYAAIQSAGLSLQKAFEAFDHNGDNMISKKDMSTTISNMGLIVPQENIDYLFKMADVSGDGLINYEEFYRLFETMIKDIKFEEKKNAAELDWKYELMLKMESAMEQENVTLLSAFKMIDSSGDQKIDYQEFLAMFKSMNLQLKREEVRNLFDAIDKDRTGTIHFNELVNYLRDAKREAERVKRMKRLHERTQQIKQQSIQDDQQLVTDLIKQNQNQETARYHMKIALLENREKNAVSRTERLIKQLGYTEQLNDDLNVKLNQTESQLLKSNELYYTEREALLKLQEVAEGGVPKHQAELLKRENDTFKMATVQLKSAIQTYKALYEASVNQTKVLKLSLERQRHEVETIKNALRDLQGAGDEKALIGKLFHQVMVAKWNTAEANRKYDDTLDETRTLKLQLKQLDFDCNKKEEEIVEMLTIYKEKLVVSEQENSSLKMKILPTISVQMIEKVSLQAKQLCLMKSQLEQANRVLREDNCQLQLSVDYFQTMKSTLTDLEQRLKESNTDEMSDQLIQQSMKLKDYRINELKAKREAMELKEKDEYYQRLSRGHLDQIRAMEEELAQWDQKYAKREEFWQRRINEQMKVIFQNTVQNQNAGNQNVQQAGQALKAQGLSANRLGRGVTLDMAKDLMEQGTSPMTQHGSSLMENAQSNRLDSIKGSTNNQNQNQQQSTQQDNIKQQQIHHQRNISGSMIGMGGVSQGAEGLSNLNVKQLKQRLQEAEHELNEKDAEITRLQQKMEERMRETDSYGKITFAVQHEENEKLSLAAHKTIQTLQSILSDKNAEINRREATEKRLKEEYWLQKEKDQAEMERLNTEIQNSRKQHAQIFERSNISGGFNDTKLHSMQAMDKDLLGNVLPEMEQLLRDKDRVILNLESKLKLEQTQCRQYEQTNRQQVQLIAELEQRLHVESKRNEPEKLKHEVETLKRVVQKKERELKSFQKAVEDLKKEIFTEIDHTNQKQKDIDSVASKLKGANKNSSLLEQQLQETQKKITTINQALSKAKAEIEEVRLKEIEWKGQCSQLKEENVKLKETIFNQQSQLSQQQQFQSQTQTTQGQAQAKSNLQKQGSVVNRFEQRSDLTASPTSIPQQQSNLKASQQQQQKDSDVESFLMAGKKASLTGTGPGVPSKRGFI